MSICVFVENRTKTLSKLSGELDVDEHEVMRAAHRTLLIGKPRIGQRSTTTTCFEPLCMYLKTQESEMIWILVNGGFLVLGGIAGWAYAYYVTSTPTEASTSPLNRLNIRKKLAVWAHSSVLALLAGALTVLAYVFYSPVLLGLSRAVWGVHAGACSSLFIPAYVAEIWPSWPRTVSPNPGTSRRMQQVGIATGLLLAQLASLLTVLNYDVTCVFLMIGVAPLLIALLGSLLLLVLFPDTPGSLLLLADDRAAREALQLFRDSMSVDLELADLKQKTTTSQERQAEAAEGDYSLKRLLYLMICSPWCYPSNRSRRSATARRLLESNTLQNSSRGASSSSPLAMRQSMRRRIHQQIIEQKMRRPLIVNVVLNSAQQFTPIVAVITLLFDILSFVNVVI
jgi:hypothetical protein